VCVTLRMKKRGKKEEVFGRLFRGEIKGANVIEKVEKMIRVFLTLK
jgi:hypothetical protein